MKNDKNGEKSAAFFSPFFVIFSSRMAPRKLKISGQTRNFISKICFSMARPPKVPGKADNWQICLFAEMRCYSDVIFWTLIAPTKLKILRYTQNSILKIVFTMTAPSKMPGEVRNCSFLPIASIWPVTLEFSSKELQIENFGAKLDRANVRVETWNF